MWVEVVFMMFVLKLPVLYVCWVVWWAVRAEPRPLEGAALVAEHDPSGWWWSHRRRRSPNRPHGTGARRTARVRA